MSLSTPQMCVSWSRRCVHCSHNFHTQRWHFSRATVTNCGVKRVSCGSCRRREKRRQTDRSLTDCSDSCAFQPRPEHQPVSQVKHTHINVPPNGDFTGRKHHSPESGRPWLWQLSPHFWRFRCGYSLVEVMFLLFIPPSSTPTYPPFCSLWSCIESKCSGNRHSIIPNEANQSISQLLSCFLLSSPTGGEHSCG